MAIGPARVFTIVALGIATALSAAAMSACGSAPLGTGGSLTSSTPITTGTFHVLHDFKGPEGAAPAGEPVLQVKRDLLYITAGTGATWGVGSVVRLGTDGTRFQTLHAFDVTGGAIPAQGSVVASDDGSVLGPPIFGATTQGGDAGSGTVWTSAADGTSFRILASFTPTSGTTPLGPPVLSPNGTFLVGLAGQSGPAGHGSVYKVASGGFAPTLRVIHAFSGGPNNGDTPAGSLAASAGGKTYYGFTSRGGVADQGVVFSVGADGSAFQVLHSFAGGAADGSSPQLGHPTLSADGHTLYGLTRSGGAADQGAVFSVGADGSGFRVLHSFDGSAGALPLGSLAVDPNDGRLYGMTWRGGSADKGVVFSLTADGAEYKLLHQFAGADGAYPVGGLTLSSSGLTLFGCTPAGGAAGLGVVFAVPAR